MKYFPTFTFHFKRNSDISRPKSTDRQTVICIIITLPKEDRFIFSRLLPLQDIMTEQIDNVLFLFFPLKYFPTEMIGMKMRRQNIKGLRLIQHIIMHISILPFRIFIIIEKDYASFGFQNETAMIYIGKLHKGKGNTNISNRE